MFNLKYKFINVIRSGSFGIVKLYKNRFTRKSFAVKQIKKLDFFPNEVKCLENLKGVSGIQQLNKVYESKTQVKLVFDYYPGMDLFDRVESGNLIKDKLSVHKLILSMAECIKLCHGFGISHNDIKMENFVFDKDGSLVLIDFGMSGFFGADSCVRIGTSQYAPPEFEYGVFYDTSDVYSLGIVYRWLSNKMKCSDYSFLNRMTDYEHIDRPTIDEVIAHVKSKIN